MVLEFGAKNFYSFKEEFKISFENPKNNIANIIALKGANASGKTNVIKVLSFLNWFVTDSFNALRPDDNIPIDSYFNNDTPIELYIIFRVNSIKYKYELLLTNKKVICEKIYKTNKREILPIERSENSIITTKKYNEIKDINLNRKNASIVSIAKQYGIKKIDEIYHLFDNISTNVNSFGLSNIFLNYKKVSKLYFKNKHMLKVAIDFLKSADIGIHDIEIFKNKNKETKKISYVPIFAYEHIKTKQPLLGYHDQSSGTQALYKQLPLYFSILYDGGILALDEFDINLHPDLLPMLLDLFEDVNVNTKNAQLILTTHNYDIMDRLGKYRTVLVNKEENESFLYRLDEIPGDIIRNDRPISPIYNANKIGGKPKIK